MGEPSNKISRAPENRRPRHSSKSLRKQLFKWPTTPIEHSGINASIENPRDSHALPKKGPKLDNDTQNGRQTTTSNAQNKTSDELHVQENFEQANQRKNTKDQQNKSFESTGSTVENSQNVMQALKKKKKRNKSKKAQNYMGAPEKKQSTNFTVTSQKKDPKIVSTPEEPEKCEDVDILSNTENKRPTTAGCFTSKIQIDKTLKNAQKGPENNKKPDEPNEDQKLDVILGDKPETATSNKPSQRKPKKLPGDQLPETLENDNLIRVTSNNTNDNQETTTAQITLKSTSTKRQLNTKQVAKIEKPVKAKKDTKLSEVIVEQQPTTSKVASQENTCQIADQPVKHGQPERTKKKQDPTPKLIVNQDESIDPVLKGSSTRKHSQEKRKMKKGKPTDSTPVTKGKLNHTDLESIPDRNSTNELEVGNKNIRPTGKSEANMKNINNDGRRVNQNKYKKNPEKELHEKSEDDLTNNKDEQQTTADVPISKNKTKVTLQDTKPDRENGTKPNEVGGKDTILEDEQEPTTSKSKSQTMLNKFPEDKLPEASKNANTNNKTKDEQLTATTQKTSQSAIKQPNPEKTTKNEKLDRPKVSNKRKKNLEERLPEKSEDDNRTNTEDKQKEILTSTNLNLTETIKNLQSTRKGTKNETKSNNPNEVEKKDVILEDEQEPTTSNVTSQENNCLIPAQLGSHKQAETKKKKLDCRTVLIGNQDDHTDDGTNHDKNLNQPSIQRHAEKRRNKAVQSTDAKHTKKVKLDHIRQETIPENNELEVKNEANTNEPRVKRNKRKNPPKSLTQKEGKKKRAILKEIAHYQKSTELLIAKQPFSRVVHELTMKMFQVNYRWASLALMALQESAESFLVGLLEESNLVALHDHRVTIMPKDMQLVRRFKEAFH